MVDVPDLVKQVKRNCLISDARFWGYYSICGLLMRMRELYLSEHGLKPWESIPPQVVSSWVGAREAEWRNLEEEELHELVIAGRSYDPFDVEGLNDVISGSGLIYGCGYAAFHKPTFFIAELREKKELFDYVVYYADRELCRDLSAYPAMLQGRCIYLRYDVVRTIILDKFQTMKARRHGGVADEMFEHYGVRRTDTPDRELFQKLEEIAFSTSGVFVLHEIGEAFEDEGTEEWAMILSCCNDKHSELYLRAIKDLLADTSRMGPLKAIAEARNRPLLNVYVAFLDGLRKELFPEIGKAFQKFVESGEWSLIEEARLHGYEKAKGLKESVLDLWHPGAEEEGMRAVRRYIIETFSRRSTNDG